MQIFLLFILKKGSEANSFHFLQVCSPVGQADVKHRQPDTGICRATPIFQLRCNYIILSKQETPGIQGLTLQTNQLHFCVDGVQY